MADFPEVRRVAEQVRGTGHPVVLRNGDEDLAILVPIARAEDAQKSSTTAEDDIAARSAFGGWRGIVDAEQLKHDVTEARGSDRPVPKL